MQKTILCVLLLSGIAFCSETKQQIPNTRAEGCFDGQCSSHCAWDGVKLFPGDALNQPGKCRLLRCSSDFTIHITSCSSGIGQQKWVGQDKSKPYPDCCGRKIKRNVFESNKF